MKIICQCYGPSRGQFPSKGIHKSDELQKTTLVGDSKNLQEGVAIWLRFVITSLQNRKEGIKNLGNTETTLAEGVKY